jgi:hypothetical protein
LPKDPLPKPSTVDGSLGENMNLPSAFQLVCIHCDALGIVFDGDAEGPPSSTIIRCRDCRAIRGTLEDLRNLALPEQSKEIDF